MAEINRKVWLVLDVVGMAILFVGALGFVGLLGIGQTASTVVFGIGIFLVIESAVFIYLEGVTVREEILEIERREAIREAAAAVPNDSQKGYILDLTEEHRILTEEETVIQEDGSICLSADGSPVQEEDIAIPEDDSVGADQTAETEETVPDRSG